MMTAMNHFLLAMVLHPEILAKAQKEIDSIVGSDRLPTFNDRPFLPYIDCIFSECLRWAAPVPLSESFRSTWSQMILILPARSST
jgi:cytochrome P450